MCYIVVAAVFTLKYQVFFFLILSWFYNFNEVCSIEAKEVKFKVGNPKFAIFKS